MDGIGGRAVFPAMWERARRLLDGVLVASVAEVAAAVRRDDLPTRVLLVSAHDESAIVFRALQEGAAGFLPKESTRSELINAVLDCA